MHSSYILVITVQGIITKVLLCSKDCPDCMGMTLFMLVLLKVSHILLKIEIGFF